MVYTYSIIDSNPNSNLKLQNYLDEFGDFKCCSLTHNSVEGLNAILKFSPDIVFINLSLNAKSSFLMTDELHKYGNCIPVFVGIANSKNFAYEAIKNNFFDYWLLPFSEFDIRKSILRLKKSMPKEETPQMLCLKSYRDFQYLNTNDILYLRADNNATEFIMKDGTINNAFKTLKTFENQLPANFIRIHQSYMVNSNYISRINYGKALCTLKHHNKQLPFSKSYRSNIDKLKKKLTKTTISSLKQ